MYLIKKRKELLDFLKNFNKNMTDEKPQENLYNCDFLKIESNSLKIIFPDKYLTSDWGLFKYHILETEKFLTKCLAKIGKKWHSNDYMLLWVGLLF
jgi:hypothetical protein